MSSSPDTAVPWAAVGPGALLDVLVPLRDEHGRRGPATLAAGDPRQLDRIAGDLPAGPVSLLVVEDPRVPSVRAEYDSPFLARSPGHDVLIGWIRLDERELAAYARRAAAILRRPPQAALPLVLLGPRERRYLDLLDELQAGAVNAPGVEIFRWSAERIRRADVVAALRRGTAAALYAGHGSAGGWFAYGGLSGAALTEGSDWTEDETCALMLSLSCRTGLPRINDGAASGGLQCGFADRIIAKGAAGAVLAPHGDPLHADNRRLAGALLAALAQGHRTWPGLLRSASEQALLRGYAVVGDPGLPAAAAPGSASRCRTVSAPAPNTYVRAHA